MSTEHKVSPQTRAMTAGYDAASSLEAAVPPVYRTSTFIFPDCATGKRAFQLAYNLSPAKEGEKQPMIYTRVGNPNSEIVEKRIISWDKCAEDALLFSSGMGAISTSLLTFLRPGDELIFTDPVYGGTEFLLRKLLPSFGIATHPIPAGCSEADLSALAAAHPKVKAIYVESPANPVVRVTDIKAAARVAHARSALLFVDNTFAGPVFCQPHTLGADVVVYSATKFIGGHSDVVAGVATGSAALIAQIRGTRTILGTICGPDEAWLLMRSLSTLELRMRAQEQNARRIVELLDAHPAVERVFYPGHASMGEEQVRIWKEQFSGHGSLVTFLVKGGEAEAFKVLDNLKHVNLAVSLGGVESLIEHPATMTHADMSQEELKEAGIVDNMIRMSVGLENIDDLLEDMKAALDLIA